MEEPENRNPPKIKLTKANGANGVGTASPSKAHRAINEAPSGVDGVTARDDSLLRFRLTKSNFCSAQ